MHGISAARQIFIQQFSREADELFAHSDVLLVRVQKKEIFARTHSIVCPFGRVGFAYT